MNHIAMQLKEDCDIVLNRVFTGQSLTFFGEDGAGQHGRSTFPVTARVRTFVTDIEKFSDDYADIDAFVYLMLDGYQASIQGHVITDMNLRINLNELLQAQHVDPTALTWGPLDLQGEQTVVLRLDIGKLLSW